MTGNASILGFNHPRAPGGEIHPDPVGRFRRRLPRFGRPLIAMSSPHPSRIEENLRGLEFTFSQSELEHEMRRADGTVAIHHGIASPISDVEVYDLLTEYLMPLAPVSRGLVRLSRADVANVLTGRIRTWDQFDRGSGAIRVLGHGKPVHHRTMMACLERTFGISHISSEIELLPSYSALARAAQNCQDCIVFGLRPSQRIDDDLAPVWLAGVDPSNPGDARSVPSLPIQIAWRRNSDRADLARRLEDILAVIAKRIDADAVTLRGLSQSKAA